MNDLLLLKKNRLSQIILILIIGGYTVFFTTQLYLHYHSFGSRALDLGNMGQTIWNSSQGRWFHQTNQPGATNRLSLHVEPILIPISWLYFIYGGPEILFLFQSIIVALGAIPVFALAHHTLKSKGLALLFAFVYLTFPAIQGATLLDFHAVTLAPTFLLAAFYYLEMERPNWFALFAILATACKEDMTLLVMMMGFYALIIRHQYRIGLTTIGLTGIWTFLAVFIIPPTFAGTENIHWGRYGHLGDSPVDIVLNFFVEPQRFLNHLQAVGAFDYFRLLLTPTAFTALLHPITLLLALPSWGINLLSSFPPMQRVNSLIYAAPTVPAVIISSIYGVARLKNWLPSKNTEWVNGSIGIIILGTSLFYHYHYGYLPGGGQFRGWEQITAHHRRAAQIFTQIPEKAALSAQDRLNPHVSQRETLYIFDRIEDADHIVLDVSEDSWPLHPVELRHRVDDFLRGEFGVVDALDGYLLLAKGDWPKELPDKFFDFVRASDSYQPQFPTTIIFDDKIELVGYSLELGAHEAYLPVVVLYWRAIEPLDQDYTLWPYIINRKGELLADPIERPLVATLWYPTSRWSPDETVVTRMLPQDFGPEFTIVVGIKNKEASDSDTWLPVTQADESFYLLGDKNQVRLQTFQQTRKYSYEPIIPPLPSTPQYFRQAEFWDKIVLQGVDFPLVSVESGQDVPFTLYWQTELPLTIDLTTFVHLLDETGNLVAQLDWTPQDRKGYLPTTAWQPDRAVVDHQKLSLPENLPTGQYRLVVGWYYAVTGDRLPVTEGEAFGNNMVEIGQITVK